MEPPPLNKGTFAAPKIEASKIDPLHPCVLVAFAKYEEQSLGLDAAAFKQQLADKIRPQSCKPLHDRVSLIDQCRAWLVVAQLKHGPLGASHDDFADHIRVRLKLQTLEGAARNACAAPQTLR